MHLFGEIMKTSHRPHAPRNKNYSHAIKPLLLSIHLACCAALSLGSSTAYAESVESINYQVKAGTLAQALGQFALQSNIVFSFDASLAEGLQSQGLVGRYPIQQGLTLLLAGSQLGYRQEGNKYILYAQATGAAATADHAQTAAVAALTAPQTKASAATESSEQPMQLPTLEVKAQSSKDWAFEQTRAVSVIDRDNID